MAREEIHASSGRPTGESLTSNPPTERRNSFLWGTATSSHQIEGGNDKNDWWAWELEGNIEGGARSGQATDHWNRFREDIRLAHELGLNSYRFSLEWSRVEPQEGQWDSGAFEWYEELLNECEKYSLTPMLTLHHFTSPKWFADAGGFTWPGSARRFAEYTKKVAQRLGSRVPLWCTFNEPMVMITGGYLGKFMPPAKFWPEGASLACRNILKSHVRAYEILKQEIQRPVEVGIAHNLLDFMPDRYWHPMELVITQVLHRFYNRSWLDAVTGRKQNFGVPGLVPKPRPVMDALKRKTVDFIGVNYYTKAYVKWRSRDAAEGVSSDFPIGLAFSRRHEAVSDVGWAVHPQGLKKILKFVSGYGLPIYITENGIADRSDSLRKEYLSSHLAATAEAIQEGMDIRGYYYWSLMDNFEWVKGFGPRFGLYSVDYDTFDRQLRDSGTYLSKLIQAHKEGDVWKSPRPDLL